MFTVAILSVVAAAFVAWRVSAAVVAERRDPREVKLRDAGGFAPGFATYVRPSRRGVFRNKMLRVGFRVCFQVFRVVPPARVERAHPFE